MTRESKHIAFLYALVAAVALICAWGALYTECVGNGYARLTCVTNPERR